MRDTWYLPLATALVLLAADVEAAPAGNILRVGDMQRSTPPPARRSRPSCRRASSRRHARKAGCSSPSTSGGRRPPASSWAATWDDRSGGDGSPGKFDLPPNPGDYAYGTNDHDLVALPNGDVLYLTGAWTRRPLAPKPAWFDVAYRKSFGPGARGNLMVWRSTDRGQNFSYVSSSTRPGSATAPARCRSFRFGSRLRQPAAAGVEHGRQRRQLVQVDRATGHLYLTFQCVGFLQDKTVTDHFHLSTVRLNKTLLAGSVDGGASWRLLGTIPVASWRFGIVPLHGGQQVALGAGTFVASPQEPAGELEHRPHRRLGSGRHVGLGRKLYKAPNSRGSVTPTSGLRPSWRTSGTCPRSCCWPSRRRCGTAG